MTLRESDVARVVKDRIFAVAFFPTTEKVIVAAGDKSGGLGIWDVDGEDTVGVRYSFVFIFPSRKLRFHSKTKRR